MAVVVREGHVIDMLKGLAPGGEVAMLVFVLTRNNLEEGGRDRHALEVCLNADNEKVAYLGEDPFTCRTDDGEYVTAQLSGDHKKNFRALPNTALGPWLKVRCQAREGDEVHAQWVPDPTVPDGRVLAMRYVRRYGLPETTEQVQARRLERETEDAVAAALEAQGVPVQRQVRTASGRIDVLTPDAIREVKTFLTRDDMLKGTGQLFVYRAEAENGPALRLILVGRETKETAALVPTLAKLGVEVDAWKD